MIAVNLPFILFQPLWKPSKEDSDKGKYQVLESKKPDGTNHTPKQWKCAETPFNLLTNTPTGCVYFTEDIPRFVDEPEYDFDVIEYDEKGKLRWT